MQREFQCNLWISYIQWTLWISIWSISAAFVSPYLATCFSRMSLKTSTGSDHSPTVDVGRRKEFTVTILCILIQQTAFLFLPSGQTRHTLPKCVWPHNVGFCMQARTLPFDFRKTFSREVYIGLMLGEILCAHAINLYCKSINRELGLRLWKARAPFSSIRSKMCS